MTVKATTARGVSSLLSSGVTGMYPSGNGLYLKVSGKGAGSWIYRYQMDGKRSKMGLGACADVSLADARAFVAEQSALIARGIDPVRNREQQAIEKVKQSITMADVARDYIAEQSKRWSASTLSGWNSINNKYITPSIGDLLPADVTTENMLALLQPIWSKLPAQAKQTRSKVETLLNAAKARKLRAGENVAAWRGHLEMLLAKDAKTAKANFVALPWDQVALFWESLKLESNISAAALRLAILASLRRGEAAGAHWSEFDLDAGVWTIPAKRMKMEKDHRVPLTSAMLELLDTLPRFASGYLFEAGKAGRPTASQTLLDVINRMHERKLEADGKGWIDATGKKITAHGFRSTFRDWAADTTDHSEQVIEACLAHASGSQVVRAYRRTDQLERRRELMEAWSEYVTRPSNSNIVQLRREA